MTTMVLGAVGAVVGGIIGSLVPGVGTVLGAQLGFMLGSIAGSLIDPPKMQGPKLNDLKLQDSVYGKMIPFVWGTGRMAGNMIDKTDLQPSTSGGGKGGPDVEETTYSVSMDLLLCARTPGNTQAIQGIKTIWADAREIWSDESGETIPCTVYFGSANQAVDPTFEAIHGVGNVPAYNNYAHVVFTDFQLKDYGNRPPQLEFEVYTKAGIFPWRVSTFETDTTAFGLLHDAATYEEGVITVQWGTRPSFTPIRYEAKYLVDGTVIQAVQPVGGAPSEFGTVAAHNYFTFSDGTFYDATGTEDTDFAVLDMVYAPLSTYLFRLLKFTPSGVFEVIGPAGDVVVIRTDAGAQSSLFQLGTSNVVDFISDTETQYRIYVCDRNDAPTNVWLYELLYTVDSSGETLVLNRTWDMADKYAVESIFNGATFAVYRNRAGRLVLAVDRGQAGSKQIYCFYLNDDLTTTDIGGTNYGSIFGQTHPIALLGMGPYLLTGDGVISLEPPSDAVLLSEIVGDLSTDFVDGTPLVSHNVTELIDEVRWFAVANVMTRRNAIATLRPCFFFDAVESDDTVKFRKRGSSSIATIPDADLCGRSEGEDAGDPLRTIRRKEQGLPRVVTMTYYDVDMDYQTGAQSSPRVTTLSESEVIVEVPVGFTASEALQKCWTIQCSEWIERESFEWTTTRKWARLEPCDVVNVRGRVIRITDRNEKPDGVIEFKGVLDAPSIYTQNAASNVGGFIPQPVLSAPVLTELVLLDIPILSQQHSPFGFYAAMGRASPGRWSGATLYKSLDGGSAYTAIASTAMPAIIGHTATSVVGSPSVSGALSAYGGGEVVEETEICVVLHDENSTLSSITATALSNGGGWCAISRGLSVGSPTVLEWEIVGIRDWTLIAPSTYIGRGFKRGRKNTLTTNHADGDTFVYLPSTINVDAPVEELNLSLKYKAVTFGKTLASATAVDFINTGQSTDSFYGEEIIHLPPFVGSSSGSPSTGGSQGLVPAPAAGDCEAGKFLSACGTWQVPPTGSSGGGYVNGPADWMFGAGLDGTAILDGTNTVTWATKVGNVYTMTQVISMANLTVDPTVTLNTNGFTLWIKDTLDNDGTINCAGTNGVGSAAGLGGGIVNSIWGKGGNGAGGGIGAGANGNGFTTPATGGGGVGGAGGAGAGGAGGAGGLIPFPAGPGGFSPTATFGQLGLFVVPHMAELYNILGTTIGGGSGGGAGGGNNPQNGGAGGGGGGVLAIFARLIVGAGIITAAGGNGGNASGGNSGGGGGGGGGLIYIITTSSTYAATMTVSVSGGGPGSAAGTGTVGNAGNSGRLVEFFV